MAQNYLGWSLSTNYRPQGIDTHFRVGINVLYVEKDPYTIRVFFMSTDPYIIWVFLMYYYLWVLFMYEVPYTI